MKTETNKKILSTAKELFSKYGYNGTSTKLIAQESGFNEVTLFRNFNNKIGILYALGEEIKETQIEWDIEKGKNNDISPIDFLNYVAELEIINSLNFGFLVIRLALEIETTPEIAIFFKKIMPYDKNKLSNYFKFLLKKGIIKKNLTPDFLSETFFSLTSSFVMKRLTTGNTKINKKINKGEIKQIIDIFWSGIS